MVNGVWPQQSGLSKSEPIFYSHVIWQVLAPPDLRLYLPSLAAWHVSSPSKGRFGTIFRWQIAASVTWWWSNLMRWEHVWRWDSNMSMCITSLEPPCSACALSCCSLELHPVASTSIDCCNQCAAHSSILGVVTTHLLLLQDFRHDILPILHSSMRYEYCAENTGLTHH